MQDDRTSDAGKPLNRIVSWFTCVPLAHLIRFAHPFHFCASRVLCFFPQDTEFLTVASHPSTPQHRRLPFSSLTLSAAI